MTILEIKNKFRKVPDEIKVSKHDHKIRISLEDPYAITTTYMSELETDLLIRVLTNVKNGVDKEISNSKHTSGSSDVVPSENGVSGQCSSG